MGVGGILFSVEEAICPSDNSERRVPTGRKRVGYLKMRRMKGEMKKGGVAQERRMKGREENK